MIFCMTLQQAFRRPGILLALAIVLFSSPLMAAHASTLYDVEILVPDESQESRWRAFVQGLDEVFVRVAGDSVIMSKLKRPPASRYVQKFSYEPLETPVLNDEDEILNYRVKLRYNGKLIEKYLRENSFPVWGEHRPDVIVWLAVKDGRNQYVLRERDQSDIKVAMEAALQRRGIPGRWPKYDAKDRKIISIADIRGGFRDQVEAASRRYTRGPALAGSLLWNGRQWQSSWSLLMPESERHWSLVDSDYTQLINKAVDQAADAMGEVYAVHTIGQGAPEAVIRLRVDGVSAISKYRQLEDYLRDLNMVENLLPLQVDAKSALFEVSLRTGADAFLDLVDAEGRLIRVEELPVEKKAVPAVPPAQQQPKPAADLKLPAGAADNKSKPNKSKPVEQPPTKAAATLPARQADHLPGAQPALQAGTLEGVAEEPQTAPAVNELPLYHYRLR